MQQQKPVGIWIRVSTEDQARGESPEHHEKRARLYAESKDWDIVTVYHLEALSGKSVMGYAETKRMLEDIRKGTITGLIFSKLARLARNTKELLEFADIFKKEEADLISLQEAIDTSSPAGRLFYTMIAAMAQWEREEIASRVAASVPIRAKLGKSLGGTSPLGYKWEGKAGEPKKFIIDEQFAPVRKLIYELFLKLKRKKAVAKYLNDNGYRSRTNKLFSDTTINQLLRDPSAKGERRLVYSQRSTNGKSTVIRPAEEWVIHPCPALVTDEIWNECNRILDASLIKNKQPGPRPKHLLAGYVCCANCDKKMYVFHASKHPTYRCTACNNRIVVQDIEEIYHDQLKTFLLSGVTIAEYLEKIDVELQEKENLLSSIFKERDLLLKKIDMFINMRINNELSKELFIERHKPMEERLNQINNQLPELQAEIDFLKIQHRSSDVVLNDANDLYSQWHILDFEAKRTIVETITDKITIGKEDINIKMSYLPSKSPRAADAALKAEKNQPPISNLNQGKRQSTVSVL
jgi:site-specific DNA recombinase